MINNEGIKSTKLLKRIFNWFIKYNKSRDVSSLLVFVVALSFINLYDYQHIQRNPLFLLPFLIVLLLAMRILDEAVRLIIRDRNKKLNNSYFYVAIFIVVTVTVFIKT